MCKLTLATTALSLFSSVDTRGVFLMRLTRESMLAEGKCSPVGMSRAPSKYTSEQIMSEKQHSLLHKESDREIKMKKNTTQRAREKEIIQDFHHFVSTYLLLLMRLS